MTLRGVGEGLVWAAGVVVAITILWRVKPVRWVVTWVWCRLVWDPLTALMRRVLDEAADQAATRAVAPVLRELHPNHGASFRDEVNRELAKSRADRRELHSMQGELVVAVVRVERRVDHLIDSLEEVPDLPAGKG